MDTNRRDFLRTVTCAALAAKAVGCTTGGSRFGFGAGAPMSGFRVAPMNRIRVGIVGCGGRGRSFAMRALHFPFVELTALCDIKQSQIDCIQGNVTGEKRDEVFEKNGRLKGKRKPRAREFLGPEAYKALCESGICDVVYNATPIGMHLPVCRQALNCGLHCMVEVEMTPEVEDNWELVELAEKTRRHLMMLENCCYSEGELLMFGLAKSGVLGEIEHGEAGYIHDCRSLRFPKEAGGELEWRARDLGKKLKLEANSYPTHGLGPVAQTMDINHGDAFDYLVSMSARGTGLIPFAEAKFGRDSELARLARETTGYAGMNTTLIHTKREKTIMLQYQTSMPRPYSRMNLVSGTHGMAATYPTRVAFLEGDDLKNEAWKYFDEKKLEEVKAKYGSPLWRRCGKIARDCGGHMGIDFLMDMRWIYCLHEGLPLDIDVYDSATWSCLAGLTQRSVDNRCAAVDIPDFTRGGWKTAKSLGVIDCDVEKIGLKDESKET